jgi:hypothetical protein
VGTIEKLELNVNLLGGKGRVPVITIALAVSHCPWIPARVESMDRLRDALGVRSPETAPKELVAYTEITDRVANPVWAESMWTWGVAQTKADWIAFGQDDARTAPRLWPALQAILKALPEAEVLCLQITHPACPLLAAEGVRLITTTDALIGVFYLLKREALGKFLEWRSTQLNPGWNVPGPNFLSEDTMIGLWCAVTGRPIFHPIPTLIDHDTSVRSVFGNDAHHYRRPLVTWDQGDKYGWTDADLENPNWWRGE